MNYLSVENISKSFGVNRLFNDLSFGIELGQKAAIVAKNGSGKSTLLRCLVGLEEPDAGRIVFRNDIRVVFMEQTDEFDDDLTIIDALLEEETPQFKAVKSYYQSQQTNDSEWQHRAFDEMTNANAWDLEVKINQILGILKLENKFQSIRHLSGGQKKRINLAKVLISDADFLILDEPTNHLDLDMIEWLEEFLSKSKATILMVTHDRYFLEVICDTIFELADETLFKYKGNFSYYLEKKAEREEQLQSSIEKAKNTFRKEIEWIRRQPKARGTKQKARIENFGEVKKAASMRIEKDELDLPIKMERLGTKIIELHSVGKRFGDKIIVDNFSYNFQRNERLGIVGNNGSGKSTFLNIIQQLLPVDAGKVVVGDTIVFGYYRQDLIKVDEDKKIIDVVREIADFIPLEKGKTLSAGQLLERFLFPRSMQHNYVYKLSGGEKRRLKLLTVLMKNPNFLILDEPTNDLDIFTLSVLEDYLKNFPGCLVVVSHDRYFMDKMVDHLFIFQGEGLIKDSIGNYSEFRIHQKEEQRQQQELARQETVIKEEKNEPVKKVLSYKEKKEYETIEQDIEKLEEKKAELTEKLSSGELSNEEIMSISDEFTVLVRRMDELMERWLYLSEYK